MVVASSSQDVAYSFGPYRFLPSHHLLLHGQRMVKLGGRPLDILHALVSSAGEVVSRETLVQHAWPRTFVDASNLRVHIRTIRRALGERRGEPTYIATVAGRGYRFIAPVSAEFYGGASAAWKSDPVCDPLPPAKVLVGRESELEEIGMAIGPGRLLTLVGPGGVGKTSIAVALAHQLQEQFPDGVCFLDLSTGRDPSLITHQFATALGLRASPSEIPSMLALHLKKRRMLVVFDNCEHVLGGVVALCVRLVHETASVFLATSRIPLNLPGEVVFRVSPLGFPSKSEIREGADTRSYPSVELFARRAQELACYRVRPDDAAAVAAICEALDGLPLAIEIAAAKLDQFDPSETLRRLQETMARHGGLRGDICCERLWDTMNWSYSLLTEEEAKVFQLLSIFSGAFELADAVRISVAMGHEVHRATAALGSLVAKSLLVAETDGCIIWYRLLAITRTFAEQKLEAESVSYAKARREHAILMLSLFERAECEWTWTEIRLWRARYTRRDGDLHKALDWCFSEEGDGTVGVDLAVVAIPFWNEQSSIFGQKLQVERALKLGETVQVGREELSRLAVSRAWSMTLARQLGSDADEAWRQAIELSGRCSDPVLSLAALSSSSIFLIYTGRNIEARTRLTHCVKIAEADGDHSSVMDGERRAMLAEMHLGMLVSARERLEQLARSLKRGLPPSRIARYKNERYVSIHSTLAFLDWLTGKQDGAVAMTEEMIQRIGRDRNLMGQSNVLSLVALPIALWRRDVAALRRFAANLRHNLDAENIAIWEPVCCFYEAVCLHLSGDDGAIQAMAEAIDQMLRDNLLIRTPMYLGVLAEAYLDKGAVRAADAAIDRAFAQQRRCEEPWCLPELQRIKARVAADRGDSVLAALLLRDALVRAVKMDAQFFQLRVARDLVSILEADTKVNATTRLCELYGLLEKQKSPDSHHAVQLPEMRADD